MIVISNLHVAQVPGIRMVQNIFQNGTGTIGFFTPICYTDPIQKGKVEMMMQIA
jgi:hypothetical protein